MIKLKVIVEELLLEALRGEWWIQDGNAIFADGEIGDMNHEAYVIQTLAYEVLDALGVEFDESKGSDLRNYIDEIFENIKDELSPDEIESWNDGDYNKILISYLTKHGEQNIQNKMYYLSGRNAQGQTLDAREYGVKHLGWQRVRGNVIQTETLTTQDIKHITEGLYDAYQEQIQETDDDRMSDTNPLGEHTFNIEVLSTRSYYEGIPWSVLAKDDPTSLNTYRGRY